MVLGSQENKAGFSAEETGGFRVGDEVFYHRASNYYGKISDGEPGVVIGFRHDYIGCTVAVSYPRMAGSFSSLDGQDPTKSSLYCQPKNLVLDSGRDIDFDEDALDVFFDA